MVGEVTLSITKSWVQNLSLPDKRSNRETSRRIGLYSVYFVSLQGLPFTLLYFIYIDLHRLLFIHYMLIGGAEHVDWGIRPPWLPPLAPALSTSPQNYEKYPRKSQFQNQLQASTVIQFSMLDFLFFESLELLRHNEFW